MNRKIMVVLLVTALLGAAACDVDESAEPPFRQVTPESASPLPTASADLLAGFEELSGLTVPRDATDVRITAENNQANLPVYRVRFTTGRGGAEQFCTADGFDAYRSSQPPDAETREEFGITVETVEGKVTCRGGHPDSRVDREAVVVFPDEETAVVHVIAFAYPND